MAKKSNVKDNVESILRDVPKTRNSDKLLILEYWKKYDGVPIVEDKTISLNGFIYLSTPVESITRARRKIQSSGLYLPTDEEVIRKRQLREVAMLEAVQIGEVV